MPQTPVVFVTRKFSKVLLLAVCCLGFLVPISAQVQKRKSPEPLLLADPTIFYDKGTYYLYGTGSGRHANGFVVYTSTNLKTWTGPAGAKNGYALSKGDVYGNAQFWAPQVFRSGSQFYMAYAANEHIGIAVSQSPLGPFLQSAHKPIAGGVKQIDPFVFADDDGKNYLYYVVVGNGGNRIYVSEMNNDLLSIKSGTEKLCIEATAPWENADTAYDDWPVIEGPTVIKQNNFYYLLYSANHFKSVDYAVGYGTSQSPLGPWTKAAGNPIIHKRITGQNGSGHGDVFKTRKGQWMYVFHTHQSATAIGPRRTAVIPLAFKKEPGSKMPLLIANPSGFRFLQTHK